MVEAPVPAVILARGAFKSTAAKTAHGLIRHGTRFDIVAVIDETCSGEDAGAYLGIAHPIPVVDRVTPGPRVLIIGVAPAGGRLPPAWRQDILEGIRLGMTIVSGLHDFLGDDPEFAAAARERQIHIWDVRRPPADLPVARRERAPGVPVVLTVGTDAAVGKRTAALELVQSARRRGLRVGFVATGQTGIMIGCDAGVVIDRVPGDFISGVVERMVLDVADSGVDLVVVEGQGSLSHHAYGAVTAGLVLGANPSHLIMVHEAGRTTRPSFPGAPVPGPLEELALLRAVTPAPLVGIALNCRLAPDWNGAIAACEAETGLVTRDVLRQSADDLLGAVLGTPGRRAPIHPAAPGP